MIVAWLARFSILAAGVGLTNVSFSPFCDVAFDCGCRALWAGADAACNIHNPSPPHCPWCLDGGSFGTASFLAIVVLQVGIALWPGLGLLVRALATLVAFPMAGGLLAILAGLWTGYWA